MFVAAGPGGQRRDSCSPLLCLCLPFLSAFMFVRGFNGNVVRSDTRSCVCVFGAGCNSAANPDNTCDIEHASGREVVVESG